MKPREFWLSTDAVSQSLRHEPKHPANWLHVIEYKAYEALKKECDVLQLEKTYYYEGLELHFNSKIDKLTEQNKIMRDLAFELLGQMKRTGHHDLTVYADTVGPLEDFLKCGSTEPTTKQEEK